MLNFLKPPASMARRANRKRAPRILLYSHDTFGLGHLRRSRAIAMAMREAYPTASFLIVTGSPIVGGFDFPAGIDFVRMPGVTKLPSGEYATQNLSLDIADTTAFRRDLIEATARAFEPDLLIVDKEPIGLRGEITPTLELMRARGVPCVLGLRDVLDAPEKLRSEWKRKDAFAAMEAFYDEIWIYGLREIYDPLQGLNAPQSIMRKVHYTGYLRRESPPTRASKIERQPFVLVTAGGGGDGDWLMDWALSAYETDATLSIPAVLVFGPFMNAERRRSFERRAARFSAIEAISFDSRLEHLMQEAKGVIAMGGYNTFCEILSFDKTAVIAPRTTPRLEQFIRAQAADKLKLAKLTPTSAPEMDHSTAQNAPEAMAASIRDAFDGPKPSMAKWPGLLDGFDVIIKRSAKWLACAEQTI